MYLTTQLFTFTNIFLTYNNNLIKNRADHIFLFD